MRKTYAAHAEKITTGAKTAILVPRSVSDSIKTTANEDWQPMTDIPPDTVITAINHLGRYVTEIGSVLAVHSDQTWQPAGNVEVLAMMAVINSELSDAQVRALGFDSLADYHEDGTISRGQGWYLTVKPLADGHEG